MMGLEELKKNSEATSVIDWDMTPEEAVTLYLEWGNNPANGRRRIRSKNDVSYYFAVNTWKEPARLYLIRRNSEEAVELAAIDMPEDLRNRFLESVGYLKGVYGVNEEIRAWLEEELYGSAIHHRAA
ncbi:MAG: hypothetical protein SWE60_10505 [Thermodesulfobacteriota bacterium]|nr:hypothetical protein [Thermodesulfobacteriota bacterium]